MSYILEALKKSNAERERGAVPDLHAQPLTLAGGDEDAPAGQAKLWLGLAAGAVIVLAAVLGWRFTAREAPPLLATARALHPHPHPHPHPHRCWRRRQLRPRRLHRRLLPSPSSPGPGSRAGASRNAEPTARHVPSPASHTRSSVGGGGGTAATRKKARAARAPQTPDAIAGSRRHGEEARGAGARSTCFRSALALLAELPDDLRRQVPAMAIGGSVYSPQRASRMLIVNGQVLREGDPVAPELQLEQIGAKAAVFSIRGQRFEVPL